MKKILIANRGEIALRIMRTIKAMGISSVAVYSEADRHSPHVIFADEAVCIGAAPSSESYLQGGKIIEFAKKMDVDAIHPGYGFLSENAGFAEQVEQAGIIFIGPPSNAINIMGSKLAAKEAVKQFDIPMVPGTDTAIADLEEARLIANEIGFPVLIKASAGGGGKGMRVVHKQEEVAEQMERAMSEAQSAFGDGSVFLEKYISSPRHIEIQILADKHGNIVHLFERECSIQRRHQKVVEEAPSTILTEELRENMGLAAIHVAKSCNYVGAGTVEFLVDNEMNFYFLEMNTRLQVEHTVTEFICGKDLVEEQIKIARGEKLSFQQEDLRINGHAVELRIYAEDPLEGFIPSIGQLEEYIRPEGEGIRLDDGYDQGMDIPIYYDPMIAKLISYGSDRKQAISRMLTAIDNYKIKGVKTTLEFGHFVFTNDHFINGDINTHFVENHFSIEKLRETQEEERSVAARIALNIYLKKKKQMNVSQNRSNQWLKTRLNHD